MRHRIKRFLKAVAELLWPSKCIFCQELLLHPDYDFCDRCAVSLPLHSRGEQTRHLSPFYRCVAPFSYEGRVRESLLRYKFSGSAHYAEIYADFLTKCIDENEISCDSITWVPLSRAHLRRRGYDQSRLLAEAVAKRKGLPCVPALVKLRNTKTQSSLRSAAERKKNVSHAYAVSDPEAVRGKHLLLIDDIATSGNTLAECGRTLLAAGARQVSAATVAGSSKT